MKKRLVVIAVAMCLVAGTALGAEEKLDEIFDKLEASAAKVKNMAADMTQSMDMGGMMMTQKGKMQLLVPDEFRLEMTMEVMGQKMQVLAVRAGKTMYTETRGTPAGTMVMKMDIEQMEKQTGQAPGGMGGGGGQMMGGNPREELKHLRGLAGLKYLGTEKIGDVDTYVFEVPWKSMVGENTAALQAQQPGGMQLNFDKVKIYLGQKHGITRKTLMFTPEGKEVFSVLMENVKINQGIDPKAFAYTPPAGVEVIDMTEMASQVMKGAPAPAPSAP